MSNEDRIHLQAILVRIAERLKVETRSAGEDAYVESADVAVHVLGDHETRKAWEALLEDLPVTKRLTLEDVLGTWSGHESPETMVAAFNKLDGHYDFTAQASVIEGFARTLE